MPSIPERNRLFNEAVLLPAAKQLEEARRREGHQGGPRIMTTHEAPKVASLSKLALSYSEAAAYVGLCRKTITKLVATGQFPQPRKVRGTVALRFKLSELDAWFEDQPKVHDDEREE